MFLLTRLLSIASTETIVQQILDAGVRLMFNGQPPGEAKSSVCGRTWVSGAMAYRCSDCQTTSNSCICMDCFKHGDHEGHDYRLYSSGYGGCCDCGDPVAWKPKGFCSKHSVTSSAESKAEENFNPEAAKTFLDNVLGVLHDRMTSYLKREDNVAGIPSILIFISKVCTFGDAPRSAMARALLSSREADELLKAPDRRSIQAHHISDFTRLVRDRVITGPASLLDVLLMACVEVRDNVHEQITKVFMDLNYDRAFKEEFAHRFFFYYPAFIANSYLPTKIKPIQVVLSTVTAQLLNFSELVTGLARDERIGLFAMLLKCLSDFFDQFATWTIESAEPMDQTEAAAVTGEGGGTARKRRRLINLTKRILRGEKSPWERVSGDLDMALDHRGLGALFTFGLTGIFAAWQRVLSLLHGMDVNKRQVGQHVEYELNDWRTAFYLDMRMLDTIVMLEKDMTRTLQTAFEPPRLATTTATTTEAEVEVAEFDAGDVRWPQIHALLHYQVQYLLGLVRSDGVDWQTTTLRALYYPPDAKHVLQSMRWSPEQDGGSFHIPLHRNLMAFVHSIAVASASNEFLQDSMSVADLLGVREKEDALLLLEHPLRCHLLLAQIDAGMWRRNGEQTMRGQTRWYRSSSLFGQGSRWDLLAMQCGVVLLGAEDFVATLVRRFGLVDFFDLRSADEAASPAGAAVDDPEQAAALAEGFFRLVLEVVTNRPMISSEHTLRKHIIQWLAADQQMTHSKLIKHITYENVSNKEVEQILGEVAVFVRPQAGKQGYFQLKPEYWNEFDPYFLHFNKAHLNTATENYHVAIKGKGLLPIATPSVPYAMFADIDDILRSPLVHSLLYTVLHHSASAVAHSKQTPHYSESVLDAALHLLMLCMRREATDRADACARDVSVDIREDESNPCSALKQGRAADVSSSTAPSVGADYTSGPFSLLDRLKLKIGGRRGDGGNSLGESVDEGAAEATSMLDLLITLRKASEGQDRLAEERPFLDELLRVARAMDEECARVIDASFEDASRESKTKTARELARERIMAQMKRQQQAFIDKSQTQGAEAEIEVEEEEGGAAREATPSVYARHPTAECVLCRETKPWDEQPLGLIGTCKRSRLLSLANQQPIRLENWRRTFLEVIEHQKAKDAGGKGKEKNDAAPDDEPGTALPEPLGVHITVRELKELMELLRGFLEESPLMVSVNHLEGFNANPRLLDMLLDAYAREVRADNSQPITDDYVQQHARDHHHEVVRGLAADTAATGSSAPATEPPSPLLYADFEQTSVLVQSCGHTIHFDCWKGYLEARTTARRNYGSHEDMLLSETFREFWCPQCRRLSNVLIPLVPSSLAPPAPQPDASAAVAAAAAATEPLAQASYERWLLECLLADEEEDEAMLDHLDALEDEEEDTRLMRLEEMLSEMEDNDEVVEEEEEEEEVSSDSDLSDLPSLEHSSDSDYPSEPGVRGGGGDNGAHDAMEGQEPSTTGSLEAMIEGDDGHAAHDHRDDNDDEEPEEQEEPVTHEEPREEQNEIEGEGEGEGEAMVEEEQADEEEEERKARLKRRAARTKMRALTSHFARHLYAVKKYRRKPSPALSPAEHPLYLLANLSYSIAALELSIRSPDPAVSDHQQPTPSMSTTTTAATTEETEEHHSVMRRFTGLSERRHAHLKDVYDLAKAALADQRRSDLRRWLRLARATARGSWNETAAKPLLATELFPLLVTWISLEQHACARATSSHAPPSASSASSMWMAPFVHVVLTAAVAQVLLSLLCYRPTADSTAKTPPTQDSEDDMEEEEEEESMVATAAESDDLACLLRYLRACLDAPAGHETAKNENESEDQSQDESETTSSRRRGLAARLPSLDVLGGRGEVDRRAAAERVLASHDALVAFVKAHTVPLLRRTALFLATCHDLPLAGLLALEDERDIDSSSGGGGGDEKRLSAEFDVLAAFLGLPPLESLLFGGDVAPVWQLVQGWWRHQTAVDDRNRSSSPSVAGLPCVASPAPFRLIELPHLFQDVFLAYLDKKCPKCNTQPSKPAICLICGTLLCAEGACCKQTRCGECFRHAIMCGGGVGLFLLAKTSGVLIITEDKSCLWGSPYFDQYGEEDALLKRGGNLFLDRSVYAHLNQLLVEHQLESEVLRADVPPYKKAQPARKW